MRGIVGYKFWTFIPSEANLGAGVGLFREWGGRFLDVIWIGTSCLSCDVGSQDFVSWFVPAFAVAATLLVELVWHSNRLQRLSN